MAWWKGVASMPPRLVDYTHIGKEKSCSCVHLDARSLDACKIRRDDSRVLKFIIMKWWKERVVPPRICRFEKGSGFEVAFGSQLVIGEVTDDNKHMIMRRQIVL